MKEVKQVRDRIKMWIVFIKIFKDYLIAVGIMIALWLLSCLIKYEISVSSFPDWFKFALLK